MKRVSLTMQEIDGFDCAGQGCLDAVCDPVERARRMWIGQPVNDRTVSARPGLFSPAEQRHKATANQTLKLGGSLLLIGDDPAIIEEDVQG